MIAGAQVVAADIHVLAGEMIVRQIDLQTRVAGIHAVRIAPQQVFEGI